MQMSVSITKIAAALLKAQASMGDATKDAKNPFFKSSYADLNAIREAAIPALNAVSVSVLQPTVVVEGKNYVRTLLLHESGEYLASDTEIVQAKQNDPQAHGSGISYARRYGLQALLNIGAVDDDGEAAMGRSRGANSVEKKTPYDLSIPKSSPAFTVTSNAPVDNVVVTNAVPPATVTVTNAVPLANTEAPKKASKFQTSRQKAAAQTPAAPVANGNAVASTDGEPQWT